MKKRIGLLSIVVNGAFIGAMILIVLVLVLF